MTFESGCGLNRSSFFISQKNEMVLKVLQSLNESSQKTRFSTLLLHEFTFFVTIIVFSSQRFGLQE